MRNRKLHLEENFDKIILEFEKKCLEAGVEILVYCGYRSFEEQAILFGKGRKQNQIEYASIAYKEVKIKEQFLKLCKSDLTAKRTVTPAIPGKSFHNYSIAVDLAPIKNKKQLVYDNLEYWDIVSKIGKDLELDWGGDWKSLDKPHFQISTKVYNELFSTKFKDNAELLRDLSKEYFG